MSAYFVFLWLQWDHAKFPTTPRELHLIVALIAVGFLLAACLIRPFINAIVFLDRRKQSRDGQAHRLMERVAHGHPLALRGRDLRGLNLAGAFLVNTDLSDTDLRGVNLSGADLEAALLRGALYDEHTRWPQGFEPERHGAVRVE
jgi:hypothetical protein